MFKIEILEIKEWTEDEVSYEKVSDKGNELDHGPTYGYIPTGRTKNRRDEITTFRQTVDKLDLHAVIKAINGIK